MSGWALPPIMMASVIFYLAAYYLFLFVRQPNKRVYLTFSLTCFSVVFYDIFCAGLYNATSISEGIAWQRAQFASMSPVTVAFLWFFHDYTGLFNQRLLIGVSLLSALFFTLGMVDATLWVQGAEMAAIKKTDLPFGKTIEYLEGELGPIGIAVVATAMASFLYVLVNTLRFLRKGGSKKPMLLFVGMLIFFLGTINDGAVTTGVYDFVYILEYSYLAIVLVMAFALSEEVVQATLARAALRESEQRLGLALTGADLGMWDWNLETGRIVTNERWPSVLGFSTTDFDVNRWEAAIHPEDRAERTTALERHFAGETSFYECEYRVQTKSGDWRWVLDRGKVVESDPNGKLVRAAGTSLDITERKSAAEERQRLKDQLRQVQKFESIGRLSAGIAHDFNNILAPILCLADLVTSELGSDHPQSCDVDDMKSAALRGKELTEQLLAYSRKQMLQVQVIELNSVVTGLGGFLRRLIREEIRIDLRLTPGLGNIMADPAQVQQILMNLVVNARDAIAGKGRIAIETDNVELGEDVPGLPVLARPGPYVMLAVQDTGHGIDEERQKMIFEPFFTTKEKGRGTGLGLATVYGIVKQHEGYIVVESAPGKGSRFVIFLPRTTESATASEEKPTDDHLAGTDAVIFVVEDDARVRKVAVRVLSKAGYRVFEAAGGVEAIESIQKLADPPQLLLTDVIMPEMNGLELYKRLVADLPQLQVLYMSGYADVLAADGFVPGHINLLRKPFTAESLTENVREALRK